VSFYWAEATMRGLPASAVEQVTPHLSCMAGTNRAQPHCAALEGRVGKEVRCSLYAQRPSTCREVQPGEDKCNRARAAHGLPPLSAA
jgi:Fe-S-cluster containining protein